MAVAALLAFGLLATNGASPVLAQAADPCDDGFLTTTDDTTCYTTADTFDVKLGGGTTLTSYWVYSSGLGNAPSGSERVEDIDVSDDADGLG